MASTCTDRCWSYQRRKTTNTFQLTCSSFTSNCDENRHRNEIYYYCQLERIAVCFRFEFDHVWNLLKNEINRFVSRKYQERKKNAPIFGPNFLNAENEIQSAELLKFHSTKNRFWSVAIHLSTCIFFFFSGLMKSISHFIFMAITFCSSFAQSFSPREFYRTRLQLMYSTNSICIYKYCRVKDSVILSFIFIATNNCQIVAQMLDTDTHCAQTHRHCFTHTWKEIINRCF